MKGVHSLVRNGEVVKRNTFHFGGSARIGDRIARIAQPIARGIDKVLGTNIRKCKKCKKRKRKLNRIGRKKRD